MSRRQWQRLSRVYLERTSRPIVMMLCTLIPMCLLFARKHGYQPHDLAVNFTLVSALLPFSVGGIILRSKADGTLAFIAGLPVSRDDHARSWLTFVLVLALPLAILLTVLCSMAPLQLRGMPLLLSGLSATLLIASAVMTMIAFQLSVRPTMAGTYLIVGMAGMLMLITSIGALFEGAPATVMALMKSELFFVGLSVVVWVVAGGAFWWSWHRIGHFMTSYVGEPPKA
jgi:hypothetical protein